MPWWGIVLIVIGVILVAFVVFTVTYGRKLQKRQAETEKAMEAAKQQISVLVIDKQRKKLKDSGLPENVIAQTPKYSRGMKVGVIKVKVGPRVMNLIADNKIYDIIPVKKTCTVVVSGIYVTEIKAVRGGTVPKLPEKKGFRAKLQAKLDKLQQKA